MSTFVFIAESAMLYAKRPMKHGHLSRGAAVIDGNFAYFTPYDSNCIYRYNIINGEWLDLPDCVCSNAALAIIDGTHIVPETVTRILWEVEHSFYATLIIKYIM